MSRTPVPLLEAFVAVAEELHFSRAAARLHLDQPALSRRVRQLERTWGVELFDRTSRTVVLTEAGQTLLPSARAALASNDELGAAVVRLSRRANRVVRLGFMTHAFGPAVKEVIRRFRNDHPGVGIEFVEGNFTDPAAGVASGATDLSVVWLPFDSSGVSVRMLTEVPRVAVLALSHPLAGRSQLSSADLRPFPQLVPDTDDETFLRFWTLPGGMGAGAPLVGDGSAVAGRCKTPEECAISLMTSDSFSIGASMLDEPLPNGLVAIEVIDLTPAQVGLAWRPDDATPEVRELVRRCVTRFADAMSRP